MRKRNFTPKSNNLAWQAKEQIEAEIDVIDMCIRLALGKKLPGMKARPTDEAQIDALWKLFYQITPTFKPVEVDANVNRDTKAGESNQELLGYLRQIAGRTEGSVIEANSMGSDKPAGTTDTTH